MFYIIKKNKIVSLKKTILFSTTKTISLRWWWGRRKFWSQDC